MTICQVTNFNQYRQPDGYEFRRSVRHFGLQSSVNETFQGNANEEIVPQLLRFQGVDSMKLLVRFQGVDSMKLPRFMAF